jgi:glycosyltransferase involved in cell wall biosynthesis
VRVLFQCRADYEQVVGGSEIQITKTAEHLRALGVEVDILPQQKELSAWDVVHVFRSARPFETALLCLNAVAQSKPLAVSTIYWNDSELSAYRQSLLRRPDVDWRLRAMVESLEGEWEAVRCELALAFAAAGALLPNTQAQAARLEDDFGLDAKRMTVVPNAVEGGLAEERPDEFVRRFGFRDFALCVARIEDHKNQLTLIEAMQGMDVPLVLIGPLTQLPYIRLCRRAARGKVRFLGALPREGVMSAYAAAKVHVLPSWWEIPGLASLEAGLAGCNIVTTDRGGTREYLGEMAWYCDPGDKESIRSAIEQALAAPRDARLREHVASKFTWQNTAKQTLAAYESLLAQPRIGEGGALAKDLYRVLQAACSRIQALENLRAVRLYQRIVSTRLYGIYRRIFGG